MKLFAKINNYVLNRIFSVKSWYAELTNSSIIKFASLVILIIFTAMFLYSEIIKFEIYTQTNEIQKLKDTISMLNDAIYERDTTIVKLQEQEKVMKQFVKDIFTSRYYTASLTGYHPVVAQCDNTPDITADGTKIDINQAGNYHYVALSRDLLKHFNKRGAKISFGDYILIKGTPDGKYDGIYQVRDTMRKDYTDWIDILLTPGEKSFYFRKILMYKITNDEYIAILKEIYEHQNENQIVSLYSRN